MKKILFSCLLAYISAGSFAQTNIANGNYYIQTSANNLALSAAPHGNQISTVSAIANAGLYTVTNINDGTNSVYISDYNSELNLDLNYGGTGNGTQIVTWGFNSGKSQKWQFFVNGSSSDYHIRSVSSGRDIAISGAKTTSGGLMILNDRNAGWNQLFKLKKYTTRLNNDTYTISGFNSKKNFAPQSVESRALARFEGSSYAEYLITNTGDNTDTYTIKNVATGYYLEAYTGGVIAGTFIDHWRDGSGKGAKWQFLPDPRTGSVEIRGVISNMDIAPQYGSSLKGSILVLANPDNNMSSHFFINPSHFSFSSQPLSSSVEVGTEANFKATPSGPVKSYQWQYYKEGFDWVDAPNVYNGLTEGSWSGGNTSQINITSYNTNWNGRRWRLMTIADINNQLYISSEAVLTLTTPAISCVKQPINSYTAQGRSETFTVGYKTSTGQDLSGEYVHWKYSFNGINWFLIEGAPLLNGAVKIPGATLTGGNSNTLKVDITDEASWASSGLLLQSVAQVANKNYYSSMATLQYAVIVVDKVASAVIPIAVDVTPLKSIKLYPNPAHSSVTVTNLAGNSTITVFDMLGNLLSSTKTSSTTATINIENYPNGSYSFLINSLNDGHSIKKAIPVIKN